jgi:tetraacyldisaccharide 4'-kinase
MSDFETYLLDVAHGRRGLVPSLLRGGLGLLAPVYCAGLKTYLLPYKVGLRKSYRLDCPVVCVGNLTTGGTGKTPMTQTLCRSLQAQGRRSVILSRGYGGENEYGCAIVSDAQNVLLNAKQAGDEAYLLASTLPGVPVVVGKDRRITGALAVETFAPDIIVLDDGMQFWQLHRDLDVVLLNACAPFDNGWTFPRGLLREPPSHLRRAGVIVLTNARRAGSAQTEAARARVAKTAPGRPVFTADLMPLSLQKLADGTNLPLDWLQERPVAALSALGNPASFEEMLTGLGADLVARFRFRDHQAITASDLTHLAKEAGAAGAQALLTTEKDAVKITAWAGDLPLVTLQVEMQIDREVEFLAAVSAVFRPGG